MVNGADVPGFSRPRRAGDRSLCRQTLKSPIRSITPAAVEKLLIISSVLKSHAMPSKERVVGRIEKKSLRSGRSGMRSLRRAYEDLSGDPFARGACSSYRPDRSAFGALTLFPHRAALLHLADVIRSKWHLARSVSHVHHNRANLFPSPNRSLGQRRHVAPNCNDK